MRRLATIAATLSLFASYASAASGPNADVIETTLRYQFSHNASGQQSNVGAYCIRVQDADPGIELISRLADVQPRVKAASTCKIVAHGSGGVRDEETGQRALIFTVSTPKCSNETHCEVEGGYYEGNASSSGNTYFLERRSGRWVVVKNVMHWIS